MFEEITKQVELAANELIEKAGATPGQLLVVGCSSSEIMGGVIGKNSSVEAAEAVWKGIFSAASSHGLFVAAQCCEHLNRALIIEREYADRCGYEPVCVVPYPHAGGSFASVAYRSMKSPVAVEHVRAHLGMDIGGTLIGMHLKDVAVPVRLSVDHIGQAVLICARTRPKYIGGERAKYQLD